ncbi:MAG: hypothetical protein ACFBRM_14625 [Pikeienuella sp.]
MRIFGLFLMAVGLAAVVIDVLNGLGSGQGIRLTDLGEAWFWFHPDSLQLFQPAVERHLSPLLWDYGIQPLLTSPVAGLLIGLGALFLAVGVLLAWRRRHRAEG